MAILKEYVCAAHGEFEAFEPVCPNGCAGRFVRREIRTAPAIRSVRTGNADAISRQLADDFGLTDLSNKDGDSVMQNLRKKDWTRVKKGEIAPSAWVGGVPHASDGWAERGEKAPTFNPATVGLQADAAMRARDGRTTVQTVVDTRRGQRKATLPIPKVRANIVKDKKGQPLAYRAPLPEV
jgi:hypothetical protein